MGWASGSGLMRDVIKASRKRVPDAVRKQFYTDVIRAFEDHDWDTIDEAMGIDPMFDAAVRKLHPDWEWDGDE